MYEIQLSQAYRKKSITFFKKHPELTVKYKKTIIVLRSNPFDPSLKLHSLKRKLSQFYSISLNYKYRIMLDIIIREDKIILVDIGSYDEVY